MTYPLRSTKEIVTHALSNNQQTTYVTSGHVAHLNLQIPDNLVSGFCPETVTVAMDSWTQPLKPEDQIKLTEGVRQAMEIVKTGEGKRGVVLIYPYSWDCAS